MSSIRGRQAERAVQLAAAHYRRAARADITKQATGMRKVGGRYRYTTKSPIDFRGTIAGGKSICLEVKEHAGVSFPLNESTLSDKQRKALDAAQKMGGEVWLVIDLPDAQETYLVAWERVQAFIARPYRHSLSLQWLRAHGYLCKESGRGADDFRIWFLDYYDHPGRATAYLAEAAERAKSPIIDLDKITEGNPAVSEKLTIEQRKANVRAAAEAYAQKNARKGWAR